MRVWMKTTTYDNDVYGFGWIDMPDYYPAPVYKDSTRQYTDEECDEDNTVVIPVPKDLLREWFAEEYGNDSDITRWIYFESTCDGTISLLPWLKQHNYVWRRVKQ